jgi:hypothetical protein
VPHNRKRGVARGNARVSLSAYALVVGTLVSLAAEPRCVQAPPDTPTTRDVPGRGRVIRFDERKVHMSAETENEAVIRRFFEEVFN